MPQAEWLRVRDAEHNWRIIDRVAPDAVLILEVYAKKTRTIPDAIIERCQGRRKRYGEAVKVAKKQSGTRGWTDGRNKTQSD
jgi:phage-related protein